MSIMPRTTVGADLAECAMVAIIEGAQAQDERMTRLVQEVGDQTDLLLRLQEHSHMQTAQITALTTQMHALQARLEASEIANREKNSAVAAKIKALLSQSPPVYPHSEYPGYYRLLYMETGDYRAPKRVLPLGRMIHAEVYEQMMSLLKEKE